MSAEAEWGPETRLVDLLLEEQQSLTLVDEFSAYHDAREFESRRYEALIPDVVPGPGQQLAFRVDLDGCTGCKACVTACHSMNGLDEDEAWRRVGLIETRGDSAAEIVPQPPALSQPLATSQPLSLSLPATQVHQQTVTAACHHCEEPACLSGCPVRAYDKDPTTGIVRHLDDQCIGCRYCQLMCPYDVPTFSERLGIVRKCDMCHDRLAEGEAPACVQGCPNGAISIAIVETGAGAGMGTVIGTGMSGPGMDTVGNDSAPLDGRLLPVSIGSMPESRWTRPTTQYVSARSAPLATDPVDLSAVEPSEGHAPLAAMLVLTQVSIGIVMAEGLLGVLFGPLRVGPLVSPALLSIAALIGLSGLGASVLHLGRPQWAFRAILGLRTSWMSREIVVLGGYAGALFGLCALAWIDWGGATERLGSAFAIASGLLPAAHLAAIGAGGLGLFCSAKIYAVTRRPLWRLDRTLLRFSMTAIWAGIGAVQLGLCLAVETTAFSPLLAQVVLALASIGVTGLRLALERGWLVASTDPLEATALSRTRALLAGALHPVSVRRTRLLTVSGVGLPLVLVASVLVGAPGALVVGLALASLALGIASDGFERSLFFRAEAMPAMPGRG